MTYALAFFRAAAVSDGSRCAKDRSEHKAPPVSELASAMSIGRNQQGKHWREVARLFLGESLDLILREGVRVKMSLRLIGFAMVIVCLLVPAIAAAKDDALRVAGLQGPTGLSLAPLMEEEPVLAGKAVEFEILPNPQLLVARLMKQEVDLAALPTNLAATLYNKGLPYKLAGISIWGVMYVVGEQSDPQVGSIKSWCDLAGKTVHVTGKGATPDILLRYFLEANGLDVAKDVDLQYVQSPVELAKLSAAGRVLLATLPEPWAAEAIMHRPEAGVVLDYQAEWRRLTGAKLPQTCLVVSAKLAEQSPELIEAFLEEYEKATTWVNENREAAGELAGKYLGMKPEFAAAAIPRCNLQFARAAEARPHVVRFCEILQQYAPASIGGKLPDEGFYLEP